MLFFFNSRGGLCQNKSLLVWYWARNIPSANIITLFIGIWFNANSPKKVECLSFFLFASNMNTLQRGERGENQCLWEPTNPLLTGLQSAACAHLLSHLIRSHPLTSSCWLCWVWLLFIFGIASGISISSWNLLIVAGLPRSEPSWGFKWTGKGSAKI